jgi:hypothetical protein
LSFDDACDDMIRITALIFSLDPARTEPHCERVEADLFAGMDDMADYANRQQLDKNT